MHVESAGSGPKAMRIEECSQEVDASWHAALQTDFKMYQSLGFVWYIVILPPYGYFSSQHWGQDVAVSDRH